MRTANTDGSAIRAPPGDRSRNTITIDDRWRTMPRVRPESLRDRCPSRSDAVGDRHASLRRLLAKTDECRPRGQMRCLRTLRSATIKVGTELAADQAAARSGTLDLARARRCGGNPQRARKQLDSSQVVLDATRWPRRRCWRWPAAMTTDFDRPAWTLVWGRRGISPGRLQKPRAMAIDARRSALHRRHDGPHPGLHHRRQVPARLADAGARQRPADRHQHRSPAAIVLVRRHALLSRADLLARGRAAGNARRHAAATARASSAW